MARNHHTPSVSNRLLTSLSPDDFALIEPQLESIELRRRHVLERPQIPIEHVYFPNSGIASIVAVVMGDDRSPQECFMQVGGEGQRVSSDDLREAMQASSRLRLFFLRYVQALLIQPEHTALANAQAQLEERLCRWLLMCHDRVDGDKLPLTHEFLATMLGVQGRRHHGSSYPRGPWSDSRDARFNRSPRPRRHRGLRRRPLRHAGSRLRTPRWRQPSGIEIVNCAPPSV